MMEALGWKLCLSDLVDESLSYNTEEINKFTYLFWLEELLSLELKHKK